ncbi:DNA sulfur modification protein DndB [Nocardia beijingensis]|uniref:DNA sulfur modification protein DndB n=1 Tax=Nocardia beijingensis TaxID=95162 RepID=UPI001893CEE3|nr:DNA sulfur modification protein DndB [Nocardia beijingensis]MBF6466384.1 DNA sulfur modification protein DndB [Nocardia beijingensis]
MSDNHIGLQEHDGLDKALAAASGDAAAAGARVFPCTVFRQGRRTMISTSFPYAFLARQVVSESVEKGGDPANTTNRPLMTDHVKNINSYVRENPEDYILPPVTLNARQLPALHVPRGNFKNRLGFMVIGDDVRFYVTDGQHRITAVKGHGTGRSAITGLVDLEAGFENDSLAVLIVVEDDLKRIHQDFADAAQTKQIPASLLAVYNTREPVNGVLADLVDRTRFFRGRVDATSKTLPKASQSVFLLNQVRQFVKELLFADYALTEDSVARQSAQLIGDKAARDELVADAVTLIETMSDHMDPWQEICALPTSGGPANRVADFRQKYVNMTATGLVIIGRVAYEIRKSPDLDWRMNQYKRLATEIDWRRSATIWQNSILSADGKVATQRGPVREASNRVKRQLGLLSDRD